MFKYFPCYIFLTLKVLRTNYNYNTLTLSSSGGSAFGGNPLPLRERELLVLS